MSHLANIQSSNISDASESLTLLAKLIAFDTTSYNSNLALIEFVKSYLAHDNIRLTLNYNTEQTKANLFASVGRADVAGVLLSGHTDVVPVAGQAWHTDPFTATHKDGKIYGRGTADMKGFIACALVIMKQAARQEASGLPLQAPLHLCLSYDEEIGCVGVHGILDQLTTLICPPRVAIIGEPTLMQVATGHKGKAVFQVGCFGQEGHSALAPNFSNAIHVASAFVQSLIASQRHFEKQGHQDIAYDIPYSTIHVGKIEGGTALNIVPNFCQIDYEIRNIAEESIEHIQATIVEHFTQSEFNKKLLASHTPSHSPPSHNPLLPIEITQPNAYPGLNTDIQHTAVQSINQLLPTTKPTTKISFGTEGGLFYQTLGCPIVVCGPGSIEVAHKPDEYIEVSQMAMCDAFLQRLLASLI